MIQTIINKLKLDGTWIKVSVNDNSFYLIAIKEKAKKLKEKEINSNDIDKISFELGIDSGIKDKPIIVSRVVLDFNDETSEDTDINLITAFTRVQGLPKEFYIRPTKIVTYNSIAYTENIETTISVKVNID